jgi:hypothetical protein
MLRATATTNKFTITTFMCHRENSIAKNNKKKNFFLRKIFVFFAMDVCVVCKFPILLLSEEDAKVVKEFPDKQVATMSIFLDNRRLLQFEYDLSFNAKFPFHDIPMEFFGTTFKEFSNNYRLAQVLGRNTMWESNWKDTMEFLNRICFRCEHQYNEVVLFRIVYTLEEVDPEFKVFVSRLIYDYFLPMLPNLSGIFHGGDGWLEFERNWIIKSRQQDIVSHQMNTFRKLLVKLNESAGTHWRCTRFSIGPKIKKP